MSACIRYFQDRRWIPRTLLHLGTADLLCPLGRGPIFVGIDVLLGRIDLCIICADREYVSGVSRGQGYSSMQSHL